MSSAGWSGYGDLKDKHEHQLPPGEKQCRRGCNHDDYKIGHTVKCAVKGCNMTLGGVCGGCGGVY